MPEGRWQQVKTVFQAALDQPAEARAEFVRTACGDDPELRSEVESLLSAQRDAGAFLSGGATGMLEDTESAGRRIGPYLVLGEVGHGGMGRVYRAVRDDDVFRKVVAIKLVRAAAASEHLGARLGREREILARLQHPNIATILDGGATDEGQPYLVMEYVEGEAIDRWCDGHGLGTRQRLSMFQLVCGAVQYAHQSLVVHRDLKPQNILVDRDGQPKLLDFGIAKLLGDEVGPESAPTATLLPMMTPAYASPEQVRGDPITTLTDVYSLGVVLYELLTGRRPYEFRNESLEEIVRTVSETEPQPPSSAAGARTTRGLPTASELRGDLDTIVLKALKKEPLRRYHSAQELSQDLDRHLSGLPVLARKDTLRYRAGKFVARHRVGVAASTLVVLSLAAGLIATLRQAHIAEAHRIRAEKRFEDVRKLATSFLFEFHDAIQALPGATPARALVVKRGLEYVDSLAQEAGGDVGLQRELATAYGRVADVQGNPNGANLGDTAGAVASLRKEVAIRTTLHERRPEDPELAIELGDANRRLGMLEAEAGDSSEALATELAALRLADGLDASGPSGDAVMRLRGDTHDRVSSLLLRKRDLVGALQQARLALEIDEGLSKAHPEDMAALRRLEVAEDHLGFVYRISENMPEALTHYRAALAACQTRLLRSPDDARVKRDLSLDYGELVAPLQKQGDLTAATAYMAKGLALDEEALAQDPDNSQSQRDVLWSLSQMAALDLAAGKPQEALGYDRRVVEAATKRVAATPGSFQARKDLAESWEDLSEVLARLGRLAEALDANRRSLSQTEALVVTSPDNAAVAAHVAVDYAERGDILERQAVGLSTDPARSLEVWREARASYERAAQAWTARQRLSALDASVRDEPARVTARVARCSAAIARLAPSHPQD